jgi:predicted phage terminase large subunit-like protein
MERSKKMINLGAIARDLVSLRRRTAQDFFAFRKYYFAHYHSTPDGAMQKELSQLLSRAVNKRGSKLAIAAPRGFAKSTLVSLEFVIYCACHKLEDFIVIVSSTQPQATNFLRDIKREFETNEKLHSDFPDICEFSKKLLSQRWSETEIITASDTKILAISTGQQIRGRRHGESRPSLIILDDIGTSEVARNPESTYNLETWLTTDILKAGDKNTNIVFVGTIHHPNSLLGKYTDPKQMPGWTTRVYKAVISYAERVDLWEKWAKIYLHLDVYNGEFGPEAARRFFNANKEEMLKGVKLLWPEHMNYYSLMEIREQQGSISFDSEYQNEPINPRDCVFDVSAVTSYDNEFPTTEELFRCRRGHLMIVGACDPALGKDRESGDYSAIVIVAIDCDTEIVYVLDVDLARRTPDKTLEDILKYYPIRKFDDFVIETNMFQSLLADELERRMDNLRYCFRLRKVENKQNKQVRIESLQPLFKSGKIQISKRHRALIEEMRFYPKGAHDDALDALELALRGAYDISSLSRTIMRRYR